MNAVNTPVQGRISVFIPPKSAQVNFLWGKNDVRTAIQQFYTPPPQKKKLLYPQNKFISTPLLPLINLNCWTTSPSTTPMRFHFQGQLAGEGEWTALLPRSSAAPVLTCPGKTWHKAYVRRPNIDPSHACIVQSHVSLQHIATAVGLIVVSMRFRLTLSNCV